MALIPILLSMTFFITFPWPNYAYGEGNLPVVGYTTQQMAINGTQTLAAIGGEGCSLDWEIVSGGGSLSASSGSSVVYTAPSTNPNCVNNPTITLSCQGAVVASLSIAINAAWSGYGAYYKTSQRHEEPCFYAIHYELYNCAGAIVPGWGGDCIYCDTSAFPCYLACYLDWVYCGPPPGDVHYTCPGTGQWTNWCPGSTICNFDYLLGRCDARPYKCLHAFGKDINCSGSTDVRTPQIIAEGCCPASLISPCQMHIINFRTDQTTINISSGQGVNISGTISGNPGGITHWTVSVEGTGWILSGSGESVSAYWNGRDSQGKELPPGTYAITLTTQTEGGTCNGNTIQRTTTINVTANPIECLLVEGGSLVNVASGNLNHSQTLFQLPKARFRSDFSLTYNSLDGRLTPLGQGWTHSYNIKLLANNDGSYTLIEGDGQKTALYSNGSRYTPQKSKYPALTKYTDNTYALEHKNGLSYHFNPHRIITSIIDRNSNALVFSYDAGNNLTGINDSSGRTISLKYDQGNRISLIFDPMGNSHYFTYSGQTLSGVSSDVVGLGVQNWVYTYDGNGNLLTRTDPGGFVSAYAYDGGYRLSQSTDPQGKTRTMAYNPSQNSTQITEKDGGLWTYTYDAVIGALTSRTDPLGHTTYYTYDRQWKLTTVTDPRNSTTSYTYDADSNVTSVTDPLGNITTYAYNALNKITAIGYPGNATVGLTYDTLGNLTSTTDSMNNVTQYGYDSRGNLTTMINALNQTTTLRYNPDNYLTAITDPAAATTSFTYDSAGNLLTQTNPLNNTVSFQYNGLNKVTRITDPLGQVSDFGYDLNGNLISRTDGNGNVTQYQYNDKGQVLQVTDALNRITRFTYGSGCPACGSGGDRLTSLIDANGRTTSFEYNPAGKLIKETNPLGDVKTYIYDGAGNRVAMTDEKNTTTQYTYDPLNRLIQTRYPDGTTKVLRYDARGNMISAANSTISYNLSYDRNNRLTQVVGDKTIQYQYDTGNRKTQMVTPDGRTITYGYNAANRLIQLISNLGTFHFSYDKAGRRMGLTYPNKVATSFTYNPAGHVTGLDTRTRLKFPVSSFSYTYDAVGNRTSLENLLSSHTYSYDPLYQLTKATHSLLPTENFNYDPTGNRSNTTVQADNSLIEDDHFLYAYDPTGNLIQKTDKAGGEKTSYTYDYENKLIKIEHFGLVARYKYDPFGRRIEKEVNGKISRYVYDEENIIAEYDGRGNITARYTHNLMMDDPLAVEQEGKAYYYHKDGLGSVAELTNSLGMVVKSYRYKSFGERVFLSELGSLPQPYTFTGREYDSESGFYYYRARYYDPKAGRFISRDPIGFQGGDTNFYRYVQNNPINWVDPEGLVCGSWWNDWIVPDIPKGYDFTNCCQRHDDCYENECKKSKTQCDEEFYECLKRVCNRSHLSNMKCYQLASRYWYFVDRWGPGAFDNARRGKPCCYK